MNKIEQGRPRANTKKPVPHNPNQRRKKKNTQDLILLIVIIAIVITVITLIVLGFNTLINGSSEAQENTENTSSTPSSVLGEYANLSSMEFAEAVSRNDVAPYLPTPTPSPAEENSIEGEEVGVFGSMVTVGDSGYEYYKYDQTTVESFISAVNSSIDKISTDVEITTMIIPSAIDIMLPLSFLEEYDDATSDQQKTITYINSEISDRALTLDIYPIMKAYCNQDIYMERDTIWTSLGAYYASTTWKSAKGFDIPLVTSYREGSAGEQTGYVTRYLGTSAVSEPEEVTYLISGYDLELTDPYDDESLGEEVSGTSIFADVTESSTKMNVFLGGTEAVKEITNNSNVNGGTIVIVGDSYSYQLAPFIAEDYYKTYLIDYTTYSSDLAAFVESVGATDLLYAFKINATISSSSISSID
ncbi:MAG: DHHW family protein [Clostridia bacterium]